MSLFTVTKEIEIDYGHRIQNHKSQCRNVHGHRGKIQVTVEGQLVLEAGDSSEGMILDFSAIKAALMSEIHARFDHHFLKAESDSLFDLFEFETIAEPIPDCLLGAMFHVSGIGIVQELQCVPTAENLAYVCFKLLSKKLNAPNVKVVRVAFYETPTSCAIYAEQT